MALPGKQKTNTTSLGRWLAFAKKKASLTKKPSKGVFGGFIMLFQPRGRRVDQTILDLPHRIVFGAVGSWYGDFPYMRPRGVNVAATRDGFISGVGLDVVDPTEVEDATVPMWTTRSLEVGDPPTFTYLTCGAGASAYVDSFAVTGITTDNQLYGGESVVELMPMPTVRPLGLEVITCGHWKYPVRISIHEDIVRAVTYGGWLIARNLEKPNVSNRAYLPVQIAEPAVAYDAETTTIISPVAITTDTNGYDHGRRALFFAKIPTSPYFPIEPEEPTEYRSIEMPGLPQFDVHQWIEEEGYCSSYLIGEAVYGENGTVYYYGMLHGGAFVDSPDVTTDNDVSFFTTLFRVRIDASLNAYWDVVQCNVSDEGLADRVVNAVAGEDPYVYWFPSAFYAAGSSWGVFVSYDVGRLQAGQYGAVALGSKKNLTIIKDSQVVEQALPTGYVIGDPDPLSIAIFPQVFSGTNTKQTPVACHLSTDNRFGITFVATDENTGKFVLMKWDSEDGFSEWADIDTSVISDLTATSIPPVVTCYRRQTEDDTGAVVGDPGFVIMLVDSNFDSFTFVVTGWVAYPVTSAVSATAMPLGNALSAQGSTADAYQVYTAPEEG